MRAVIGLVLAISISASAAQTLRPRYTGCVTTDMDGNLTFCEPDHCSLLSGQDVSAKLSGHRVTVEGAVTESRDGQPRRVVVTKIVSVGAACNQTCTLYPVHRRGIGTHDKPGSEGGTPGVTTKPPQ